MGTISITFRVPVVDKSAGYGPPFKNFRASDSEPQRMWRGCSHRHKTVETAKKCARSMSLGVTDSATNERVEIRGYGGHLVVEDGKVVKDTRRSARKGE